MKYFVYVLRSSSAGRHYIGIAADVLSRLREHNTRSGRWTSRFKPWELIATEEYPSRSAAYARERFLKSGAGISERRRLFAGGAEMVRAEDARLVERP
ncbi:MAG: GIY-YIG nuclease family protein [Bryobacteraceae bacterium]